ncbi:STAS/SEC14 domain-containing protein [Nibribacter ruber]|uniref:STAS/SEC14 domain-containing protein n=1 Tax=Nibribacter ruber TaxID=2698458 RepID=A0A6P1P187_9BACT|nr:STAS/SEC14 domain-containing protein [Nibribacter ruber]QHL87343.1 STAS/SEC14 domain-containing protein [Nibribacter ruber]
MIQELVNPFGKVYLTIKKDAENKLIYVNWVGYLTEENVKTGALAYTKTLAEAGFHCVLNDTRSIVGSWNHSMDWVVKEWAPSAAKAGLKRIAMLSSPQSFGETSADTFIKEQMAFEAKCFDDMEAAKRWLQEQYTTN